jgi:hypothetical protein
MIKIMRGAARHLRAQGICVVYGPFRIGGRHTAQSNEAFDADLKRRDARFGVRDLEALVELAAPLGLDLQERVEMPANNQSLVFVRSQVPYGNGESPKLWRHDLATGRNTPPTGNLDYAVGGVEFSADVLSVRDLHPVPLPMIIGPPGVECHRGSLHHGCCADDPGRTPVRGGPGRSPKKGRDQTVKFT